jgi:hypothetical protein
MVVLRGLGHQAGLGFPLSGFLVPHLAVVFLAFCGLFLRAFSALFGQHLVDVLAALVNAFALIRLTTLARLDGDLAIVADGDGDLLHGFSNEKTAFRRLGLGVFGKTHLPAHIMTDNGFQGQVAKPGQKIDAKSQQQFVK